MSRVPKHSRSSPDSTSSGHWKPTCDVRAWGCTEFRLAWLSSAAPAARSGCPSRQCRDCRDETYHRAASEECNARFGEAPFLHCSDVLATQSHGLALPCQDLAMPLLHRFDRKRKDLGIGGKYPAAHRPDIRTPINPEGGKPRVRGDHPPKFSPVSGGRGPRMVR